jgi:Protein of unknown function (DUF3616)
MVMTRFHIPIVILISTMLSSAVFVTRMAGAAADPVRISGGTFEASGVAHVPSTSSVLFVDDGRNQEVFWLELNADGSQKAPASALSLQADVTDLEGITHDGSSYYVVGSQSKSTGFDGDGLVRFRFDPATKQVEGVERVQGLKKWLADNVAELKGTGARAGDSVLNIEGIAWDPVGKRLLLGLRAPVIDDQALIIALTLRDAKGPLSTDNLAVQSGKAIRLSLGGAGIRSIEYDAATAAFRIITGAGLNKESREFRVVEWKGEGDDVREVARYSSKLKPEGITRTVFEGKSRTLIVFDTGRFTMLD